VEWKSGRRNEGTWRIPGPALLSTDSTQLDQGLDPDHRCGKLTTNCLGYSTAQCGITQQRKERGQSSQLHISIIYTGRESEWPWICIFLIWVLRKVVICREGYILNNQHYTSTYIIHCNSYFHYEYVKICLTFIVCHMFTVRMEVGLKVNREEKVHVAVSSQKCRAKIMI
jgi:hypothetical protein